MVIPSNLLIPSIIYFLLVVSSNAATSKPSSLLIPIRKHTQSLQYYATLQMGTNIIKATIDLNTPLLYVSCDNYTSTSKHQVGCDEKLCLDVGRDGCLVADKEICAQVSINPFRQSLFLGSVDVDKITVGSTDGRQYLSDHEVKDFVFSCVVPEVMRDSARGNLGVVGLARTRYSFQTQLAQKFKLPNKFALCIPSSNEKGLGDLFIGGGPYYMPPYTKDLSASLIQTPLLINPVSTAPIHSEGDASYEYFIGVKSIRIGGKDILFNTSLLTIDANGVGGTKLSTIAHFTILHTSIYKAVASKFIKKFASVNVTRVASVSPFGACFNSKNIENSKTGLVVPTIDLVLQNDVVWRINGHNSMKQVNRDVACLGFVDGGSDLTTSIALGGHQLEDNLIEFDLVSSKFGFSNSLLVHDTSCSHFRHPLSFVE